MCWPGGFVAVEAVAERMSVRGAVVLAFLAGLLAVGVYQLEFRPVGQGSEAGPEALFENLSAADVDWVELPTTDGRSLRAERIPSGWEIVSPSRVRADAIAFDGLASQLASLVSEGHLEAPGRLEDFGVGDSADRIRFGAQDQVQTLRLGGRTPVGGHTYVRVNQDSAVAWIATWRTNALRKSWMDWRDRRVLDFDQAAIDSLEVDGIVGPLQMVRRGMLWFLTQPIEVQADVDEVESLLTDLAFLQADGFIDEDEVASALAILQEPTFDFRLQRDEGELAGELRLAAWRDGQWVASGRDGTLFLLSADRFKEWPRRLFDYRAKSLGGFDVTLARSLQWRWPSFSAEGAPSEFEAHWRDGRWLTDREGVSQEQIRASLDGLSRLEAVGVLAEALGSEERSALGLSPERVWVRVTGEEGEVLTELLWGRYDAATGWPVVRADSPTLYRVEAGWKEFLPMEGGVSP